MAKERIKVNVRKEAFKKKIRQAMTDLKVLALTYRQKGEQVSVKVEPYSFRLIAGTDFLMAYDLEARQLKAFALPRYLPGLDEILKIAIIKEDFEPQFVISTD